MPRFVDSLRSFLEELRRRRVYRVAAFYAAGAYVVVEIFDLLVDAFSLPSWIFGLLVIIAGVGFPVVVALAWAFQITPEGSIEAEDGSGPEPGLTAWLLRGAVAGVVILISAAVVWTSWTRWLRPDTLPASEPAATTAALDPTRLAVLYFDDHSPGRELGFLADGLTEALIHELSQIEALEVVSRNGVKPYRDAPVPLDSVIRTLRVGSLVEGSVTQSGGRIRATVQLIDAGSGAHLASQVIERPWGELFELQEELTREVARGLRKTLGNEVRLREQRAGTRSVEAWTLFRQAERLREEAVAIWRDDPEAGLRIFLRADSLLAEAESRDPRWAQLPYGRARIARNLAMRSGPRTGAYDTLWTRHGLDHAARAARLDEGWADPYALRGALMAGMAAAKSATQTRRLRTEAEAALRRATSLDPDLAPAWLSLTELFLDQARFTEARAAAARALESDAFLEVDAAVIFGLYYSALQLGPEEDARRWCHEGRRRFPRDSDFVMCQLYILASFPQVEPRLDRAWALVDTLESIVSESGRADLRAVATMQVAKVAARTGRPDSARALIRRAYAGQQLPWLAYDEAHTRLLLDDPDGALRLLATWLEANPEQRSFLDRDWWFEELRTDPRFRALVTR